MYCGECGKECEVHTYWDGDGDGVYTRTWLAIESKCCGAEVFVDDMLTIPVDGADLVDDPIDTGDL
jgi:hypothetical protein